MHFFQYQRAISSKSEVLSWILARFYTFVEIDHEIFSMDILNPWGIQKGLAPVTSQSMNTKYWLNA